MSWSDLAHFIGGVAYDISAWLIEKGQEMLKDLARHG